MLLRFSVTSYFCLPAMKNMTWRPADENSIKIGRTQISREKRQERLEEEE